MDHCCLLNLGNISHVCAIYTFLNYQHKHIENIRVSVIPELCYLMFFTVLKHSYPYIVNSPHRPG